jgi:hypothetical protein
VQAFIHGSDDEVPVGRQIAVSILFDVSSLGVRACVSSVVAHILFNDLYLLRDNISSLVAASGFHVLTLFNVTASSLVAPVSHDEVSMIIILEEVSSVGGSRILVFD